MDEPRLAEFDLTGTSAPEERPPAWPPAARNAAGCGIGCVLAVLLQAVVLWGLIALAFNLRPPEGLKTSVTVPARVSPGQPFPLTLVVRNTGDRPFTLTNLTLQTPAEVALENPQPAPLPTKLPSFGGTRIWSYQKRVAPGEEWRVKFDATTRRPGVSRGMLQVQVDLAPQPVPFTVRARDN